MKPKYILAALLWVGLITFGVWRLMGSVGIHANQERQALAAGKDSKAAVNDFMGSLKAKLQASMQEGGPTHALNVCGDVAQEMTQNYANEKGWYFRRTALRLRNPLNAPDIYEKAWMERTAFGSTAEVPIATYTKAVTNEEYVREYHLMEPIYVAEACLVCHGSSQQIPDEVEDLLAEKYPSDSAIDFKVGEFRGILSIRIPLPDEELGE